MSLEKYHILVVDDDTRLRALLVRYLTKAGFFVTDAKDSVQAESILESSISPVDMMVLDVMMPGRNGVEFTKEIRKQYQLPVLLLTALGEAEDRIAGLESGADDYLVKPFEPRELVLRIKGVLRRGVKEEVTETTSLQSQLVTFGPYAYHVIQCTLYSGEEYIALTSTEITLLSLFSAHINQSVSREQLSQALQGISERSVDVAVTRLRKKIEDDPKKPIYLQSRRGEGYVLVSEG